MSFFPGDLGRPSSFALCRHKGRLHHLPEQRPLLLITVQHVGCCIGCHYYVSNKVISYIIPAQNHCRVVLQYLKHEYTILALSIDIFQLVEELGDSWRKCVNGKERPEG